MLSPASESNRRRLTCALPGPPLIKIIGSPLPTVTTQSLAPFTVTYFPSFSLSGYFTCAVVVKAYKNKKATQIIFFITNALSDCNIFVTPNVNKALHQNLTTALLDSLEDVKGFNRKTFEEAHKSGEQVVSVRLNPQKEVHTECSKFQVKSSIPWCPYGRYLNERPSFTLDPL